MLGKTHSVLLEEKYGDIYTTSNTNHYYSVIPYVADI